MILMSVFKSYNDFQYKFTILDHFGYLYHFDPFWVSNTVRNDIMIV